MAVIIAQNITIDRKTPAHHYSDSPEWYCLGKIEVTSYRGEPNAEQLTNASERGVQVIAWKDEDEDIEVGYWLAFKRSDQSTYATERALVGHQDIDPNSSGESAGFHGWRRKIWGMPLGDIARLICELEDKHAVDLRIVGKALADAETGREEAKKQAKDNYNAFCDLNAAYHDEVHARDTAETALQVARQERDAALAELAALHAERKQEDATIGPVLRRALLQRDQYARERDDLVKSVLLWSAEAARAQREVIAVADGAAQLRAVILKLADGLHYSQGLEAWVLKSPLGDLLRELADELRAGEKG